MLTVLVCQHPSTHEPWQAHLRDEPIDLVSVVTQGQECPLSGRRRDRIKPASRKKLNEQLAGDRIIFDDKDHGLATRSGEHLGFSRTMLILRPTRLTAA